jgi:hypothetical protein
MDSIDEQIAEAKKNLESLQWQKEYDRRRQVDNEFHERGYKIGVVVIPVGFMENRFKIESMSHLFNEKGDFCMNGRIIHSRVHNSWAQIVKTEDLKIGTYAVTVVDSKAYINEKYYTLEELTTFSELMTNHSDQIKFLLCGCHGEIKVGVDTINAIISLIKNSI